MSFYPLLPDELKLMIWEEAINCQHGGVYHFKIGFDQPRTYEQTLTVYPQRDGKDNPSSSAGLWRLSTTCRMSWYLVKQREHADRVLFWRKMPKSAIKEAAYTPDLQVEAQQKGRDNVKVRAGNKIPKPAEAFLNGDKDIVCFTVVGTDFNLDWLNWANNHQRFRHLTHVAFEYLSPAASHNGWITAPFECICWNGCTTYDRKFCVDAVSGFLRIFENLQTFYFIIPIAACRLARPTAEPLSRGTERKRGGRVVKKTGPQLVTEAMDKFKVLAQERGLSVFQDRKKTYYEVDDSGMSLIKGYEDYDETMTDLTETWHLIGNMFAGDPECPWHSPRSNWGDVRFKFLVCQGK